MSFGNKPISIIMAFVFVLISGCSSTSNGILLQHGTISNLPKSLTIWCEDSFLDETGQVDQVALEAWNKKMTEQYGIPVTITNQTIPDIACYKGSEIYQCAEIGSILPLEGYLKENKAWNSLPENFRKRFEFNGHIWTIPRRTSYDFMISSIRTDWLENVNLPIPANTTELMEAGKAFINGDANDNGEKDDYVIGSNFAVCSDIFNSFGLYISSYEKDALTTNFSPIAYDPILDSFVDGMFKPESKGLFQYIRDMYTAGTLDVDIFWSDNTKNNLRGLYGTVQTSLASAKYDISEKFEALPPLSKEYPVTFCYDNDGFVIPTITSNPGEVINAFVDMVFGTVANYLDWSIGTRDTYIVKSDGTIACQYKDKDFKTAFTKPNLLDCSDIILRDDFRIVYPGQDIKSARVKDENGSKYEEEYIQKHVKSGQLYQIPSWYTELNKFEIRGDNYLRDPYTLSVSEYKKALTSLIKTDISIDEIIETYQTHMLDNGNYKEYLKKLNQAFQKRLALWME